MVGEVGREAALRSLGREQCGGMFSPVSSVPQHPKELFWLHKNKLTPGLKSRLLLNRLYCSPVLWIRTEEVELASLIWPFVTCLKGI